MQESYMNGVDKRITTIVGCIIVLMSILFVTSCDIGLGAQVDVGTPSASISYPPTQSIIKGMFTIVGTCSDDMGVTKVAISVAEINTSTNAITTIGTLDVV